MKLHLGRCKYVEVFGQNQHRTQDLLQLFGLLIFTLLHIYIKSRTTHEVIYKYLNYIH